jgi:hypothetical protein
VGKEERVDEKLCVELGVLVGVGVCVGVSDSEGSGSEGPLSELPI